MPQVKDSIIEQMLQNIQDPQERQRYAQIANGQITHQVRCLSDSCQGAVVGFIYGNGEVVSHDTEKDGLPVSGILSSRPRLDGFTGYSCHCGNRSILSQHEDGIISFLHPSKNDLAQIAQNLQDAPSAYGWEDGRLEVDGFVTEEVK